MKADNYITLACVVLGLIACAFWGSYIATAFWLLCMGYLIFLGVQTLYRKLFRKGTP
jgi:threonine/homoserine/homoserine lactone efflux protein